MHRITRLDGLRALAVFTVIQQHWGVAAVNRATGPGGFGVDCFFVLSGFLITGILLRARTAGDHSASLTAFYLRRALRIVPAYYLVLIVAGMVTRDVSDAWPWHAAYGRKSRTADIGPAALQTGHAAYRAAGSIE